MKSLYLWIWNFLGVGGTKWKNHGNSRGWGSNVKPSEMENPRGWGVKLEKTLRGGGGGMDIFWNHTLGKEIAPICSLNPGDFSKHTVWSTRL